MKKIIGRLSLALVLIMAVSMLFSCMNDLEREENQQTENTTEESEKSDEELIIGKWEAELDMSEEFYKDVIAEDELMAEYFNISGFVFKLEMNFKRSGKCAVSISEESVEKAVDNLKQCMLDGFDLMFKDLAKENNMTVSEIRRSFEISMGMNIEEYVDFAITPEDLLESMGNLNYEGKYKIDGGKLYLSETQDEEIDENEYITYTISKDELKFLGETPIQEDDFFTDFYPLTFKRVKVE